MKKLLNTLFVTSEDAYLTLDGENVVVNREKQVTARFPLHALAGIISFSYAGASPALMGACAKRAGAWIEILHVSRAAELGRVAPFTGAWIEIQMRIASCRIFCVAPLVGAFCKEPDAEKSHVRNSVKDTFGNRCIDST